MSGGRCYLVDMRFLPPPLGHAALCRNGELKRAFSSIWVPQLLLHSTRRHTALSHERTFVFLFMLPHIWLLHFHRA